MGRRIRVSGRIRWRIGVSRSIGGGVRGGTGRGVRVSVSWSSCVSTGRGVGRSIGWRVRRGVRVGPCHARSVGVGWGVSGCTGVRRRVGVRVCWGTCGSRGPGAGPCHGWAYIEARYRAGLILAEAAALDHLIEHEVYADAGRIRREIVRVVSRNHRIAWCEVGGRAFYLGNGHEVTIVLLHLKFGIIGAGYHTGPVISNCCRPVNRVDAGAINSHVSYIEIAKTARGS
jgi:hypothetical protein